MNSSRRTLVVQLVVVFAVCGFFFFFGLGAFGLVGADEPRYAQIAREMFTHHDWIVPTLNGQPWLEKPAFLYWKIWNSYALFGISDWAARIPAAGHALTLVLVMFCFMRRFRPGAEIDAALITASSAAVIGFARGASTDMVLSSHFTMAMLAWWAWHETGRKLWLAFFYILLAFGTLSKGPVAPGLAVLLVLAYTLLRRDKRIFLHSLWPPGFLLFFLIALPWYIAVQLKVPQFFRIFFVEHNLERFGTNLYQHSQPFWYYLPVFLLSMLPWTIFTLMAIVASIRNKVWRSQEQHDGDPRDDPRLALFLLLWIVIPIVFFSISRSKLPGYILPAIPAAALLTADYLHRTLQPAPRWTVLLHSVLCGGLVAAALLAPARMARLHLNQTALLAAFVGAGVTAILVLVVARLAGPKPLPFATLVPVIVILAFLLGPAAPAIDEVQSARSVHSRLQQLGAPGGPILVFNVKRDVEYGLNFYRNQPIGRYQRDPVPPGEHIVIGREGDQAAIQAIAGPRQVSVLGNFPPQHLEFFLVSKR